MVKNYIEEYAPINGIKQYFIHFSGNSDKPVVLYLHGGPGSSESLFAHYVENENNGQYTMVYYDQRGSGKTYTKNKGAIPTMDLLQADLLETVKYIKKKYNKDKVIILGHSFGSMLGSLFIKEHPEEVLCYIGAAQVIDIMETEKFGYEKLLDAINKENNRKVLRKLDKIGTYPSENFDDDMMKKLVVIRKLQTKYKLCFGIDKRILGIVFKSPILQFSDFISMLKAMKANKALFHYLGEYSLYKYSTSYEVPIYYITGENDYTTPHSISEKYFQGIEAPNKKIYLIKNAGHMAMIDNVVEYQRAVVDIINLFCEKNSDIITNELSIP